MNVFLGYTAVTVSMSTMFNFTGFALPVIAGENPGGVLRISQEIATGNSFTQIPLVELSPGYGVNISFIRTGEIVEKVWLDNPGIASLDVDGCLSGLGRECESSGATVIHLRRINPLNVPQLPKTTSSLLTVVTKGNSRRQLYLFQVAMGDTNPKYHTIEVTPTSDVDLEIKDLPVTRNISNLNLVSRGLEIAEGRSLISPNSRLWRRIENFLLTVKAGDSISNAAQKSGISLQLVNRLIQLGNTSQLNKLRQDLINNSNDKN
jgi:hypothetical protein